MNLKEILENKELAVLKKISEIQKSDYSNVLLNSVEKAVSNNESKIEVLVYEAVIDKKRNEEMFKQYLNGWVLNHSIGMRYVKIFLCYNSENLADSQEKENWNKYYPFILNKEDVGDYFWAVTEAKRVEASAVVKGSNFLTPVLKLEVIDEEKIKLKCAISPCNILDSHNDVHISGVWKKNLAESSMKYDLLLKEHNMSYENIIADSINNEIKVYTEIIDVKLLASKFTKKTEAVKDTSIDKNHEPSVDTQIEKKLKEILTKFN